MRCPCCGKGPIIDFGIGVALCSKCAEWLTYDSDGEDP